MNLSTSDAVALPYWLQHEDWWVNKWRSRRPARADDPEKVGVTSTEALLFVELSSNYDFIVYLGFSLWRKMLTLSVDKRKIGDPLPLHWGGSTDSVGGRLSQLRTTMTALDEAVRAGKERQASSDRVKVKLFVQTLARNNHADALAHLVQGVRFFQTRWGLWWSWLTEPRLVQKRDGGVGCWTPLAALMLNEISVHRTSLVAETANFAARHYRLFLLAALKDAAKLNLPEFTKKEIYPDHFDFLSRGILAVSSSHAGVIAWDDTLRLEFLVPALRSAVENGSKEMVKFLLSEAKGRPLPDQNRAVYEEPPILYIAACDREVEIVKMLVNHCVQTAHEKKEQQHYLNLRQWVSE